MVLQLLPNVRLVPLRLIVAQQTQDALYALDEFIQNSSATRSLRRFINEPDMQHAMTQRVVDGP
jgi:hypothetical protein